MPDFDPYRLPRTVVPRRYEVRLEPDLDAATFTGTVTIEVEVMEPTADVVLNALELEIHRAWVTDGDVRLDASVSLQPEHERATLALDTALGAGPARVHIDFTGVLNDKLVGFYRSTFTDDAGATHVIATTQMEATYARQAFPCWDEPDLKAVFGITLVVDDDLTVLSNNGEVSSVPTDDGRRIVTFADTMVMSTYLVAFAVGPLELTDPVDVDGIPLRVAFTPGKKHLSGFALEVGAFALRYLRSYYDIPYPADKLDLVGIPDFAFGAMENVGCVMFRETLLLVDPTTATHTELERIVDVIAHEIAHMWFGNLVTMSWWNGIWLNEAFATFMELKGTDAFRPEWHRWASFGIAKASAMDTDALATTRPIEFEVVSPVEAEGMFDVLTYEKGGAVVRMLEQFLGEDRFRAGIAHYLRKHSHGNAETTGLWDAIEEATGEPVRRIMDSWIFQAGHPVVDARIVGDELVLHQERFRYDGEPDDTLWLIPAIVTTVSGGAATVSKVLLDQVEHRLPLVGPVDLVKVNTGFHGFYRTRLSTDLLAAVSARAATDLNANERFALASDTWASVLGGFTPVDDFVALARQLSGDDDPSVWEVLTDALGSLVELDGTPAARSAVAELVAPVARELGLDVDAGESDTRRQLRELLITFRGLVAHDPEVIEWAGTTADRAIAGEDIEPGLVSAALRVAAAFGDANRFDQLAGWFKDAPTPQEQMRALYALADARDPDQFDRLLDLVIDSGDVRSQSGAFVLRAALENPVHGPRAWNRIRQSWQHIVDWLPSSTVPRMFEGVRDQTDPAVAADIEAFVLEDSGLPGSRSISQHLERMQVAVGFAERERAAGRTPFS